MQLSTVLSVPVIAVVLNQLAEAAGMVPEAVRVIVVLVCVIVGVAFAMAGLERLHIDNERRRRELPPPADDWLPGRPTRRRR